MESINDILNTLFPVHILNKNEYKVAVRVIRHFRPDIPSGEMDGSKLKPIANLIELNGTVLEKYYGLKFTDVFDNNRLSDYNFYRRMCYCASMDVLGLDRYTVQRSFTQYRKRNAVYVGINSFREELKHSEILRSEYDKYKGLLRKEYERRDNSIRDSDLDIDSDSNN